ncbi:CrpP-related protein [Achromobacter sp. MY14]|uniref:CrpP-related protein n=1 Tax=unclassified Achromobacter TaxID=2626865 RepID=UPI00351D1213
MWNWARWPRAAASRYCLAPFLKAHNMPGHSGQPIHEWQAAVDAWEAGWLSAQDDVCGPQPASRVLDDDVLLIGFPAGAGVR